jgi:hypothetical protein
VQRALAVAELGAALRRSRDRRAPVFSGPHRATRRNTIPLPGGAGTSTNRHASPRCTPSPASSALADRPALAHLCSTGATPPVASSSCSARQRRAGLQRLPVRARGIATPSLARRHVTDDSVWARRAPAPTVDVRRCRPGGENRPVFHAAASGDADLRHREAETAHAAVVADVHGLSILARHRSPCRRCCHDRGGKLRSRRRSRRCSARRAVSSRGRGPEHSPTVMAIRAHWHGHPVAERCA